MLWGLYPEPCGHGGRSDPDETADQKVSVAARAAV
jgi:hypothetical protein